MDEIRLYHDLGLSVFSLPYGSKVPDMSWKRFQRTRAPPEELEEMFSVRRNIAIVTGRISNLVFVDLDSQEALYEAKRRLPATRIVSETQRGLQLGYRPPSVPLKNAVKLDGLFDIRSDGGYVVAPSSRHPSGFQYKRLGDWLDQNVPEFPEELIPKPKEKPIETRPLVSSPQIEWARKILFEEYWSIEGAGGDHSLFKAACFLVQRAKLSDADSLALLREWNLTNAKPPWPDERRLAYKISEARRLMR